jgi:hypothetical protein
MLKRAAGLITGATLIALAVGAPSLADPVVPTQQSKCEVSANRYKAQHPHLKMFLPPPWLIFGKTLPPPEPPSTYRNAASGITFYVESDGRHLAAIDGHGRLLWVRNPFVDANLCPYRSTHPYILRLGAPASHSPTTIDVNAWIAKELNKEIDHGSKVARPEEHARFIYIEFNSSQFGYVNIAVGYFYWMGQN